MKNTPFIFHAGLNFFFSFLCMIGVPSTKMVSFVFKSLHEQFTESEIKDFDDFHAAILEILNVINSALPGKHCDTPARSEVEKCFEEWKNEQEPAKKKEVFIQFIKKIKLSKLDNTTIMTGIITPPAAMAAKKAGEILPQLSLIKGIPDVVFVPSVTVIALVISKLSRRLYMRSVKSQTSQSRSFDGDKIKDHEPPSKGLEPPSKAPVAEEITPPCPPN
ncbi:uncharacterized protein LOC111293105 [Durio zibethinus]|uniref:Uncharacterized protein LOC111293105 n=1 Tax=Durio zibethinus TaxID=66656 RepID=A0A6P5YMQ4_DURZI|nr:uncharacterized protein LOC111293105 [Durio zibethinus]